LSPTPVEIAKYFYHEDYTLGLNKIESTGANVLIRTLEPEWLQLGQPHTDVRHIRRIRIDRSLSVQNEGGEIEWIGPDPKSRKGCNPFRRAA
jgi:hypothetical protein